MLFLISLYFRVKSEDNESYVTNIVALGLMQVISDVAATILDIIISLLPNSIILEIKTAHKSNSCLQHTLHETVQSFFVQGEMKYKYIPSQSMKHYRNHRT